MGDTKSTARSQLFAVDSMLGEIANAKLLGGVVAFAAVFLGIANASDEVIGESRGSILVGMSLVALAAVNIGVLRFLRLKKKAETLPAGAAAEDYESKNWDTRHPEGQTEEIKERAKEIEKYLDEVEGKSWTPTEEPQKGASKKKPKKIKKTETVVKVNTSEPEGAGFDDRYMVKKNTVKKGQDMDQWDKVDWGDEFERVNGDRRAFGEMNAQERTHMELLKMYQKNPAEVEKLAKQVAPAVNAKKKAAASRAAQSSKAAPKKAGTSDKQHAEQLQEMLKNKGFDGGVQVLSGADQVEEKLAPFKDRIVEITE